MIFFKYLKTITRNKINPRGPKQVPWGTPSTLLTLSLPQCLQLTKQLTCTIFFKFPLYYISDLTC